jgi:hypothetical protein
VFDLFFLFVTTAAASAHLARFIRVILPRLPGMDDLAVFRFAPRTNLDLLALLIFDVAPVACMKTQCAFTLVEKFFQHVRSVLSRSRLELCFESFSLVVNPSDIEVPLLTCNIILQL